MPDSSVQQLARKKTAKTVTDENWQVGAGSTRVTVPTAKVAKAKADAAQQKSNPAAGTKQAQSLKIAEMEEQIRILQGRVEVRHTRTHFVY